MQMKYHPDKNQGSQDAINMTQQINGAYEILGDEQKKSEYDMMQRMKNKSPFTRMHRASSGTGEVPIHDIMNMFFGGGGGPSGNPFFGQGVHLFHGGGGGQGMPMSFQQAMHKPVPIMQTVQVNMEQVLSGATVPIEIERWMIEEGNKLFEKETIYITIPAGIDDREMIILRDKGNIINEHCQGDIKLTILVENNTAFKRSGLDLILEKEISLKEALCGFSFDIQYINGKSYTLNNNRGSIIPPLYKKVYPEMGLKRGEHKGNMIIVFHVKFPEKLTDEQIESLSNVL
jgi:DnaJ-class molecular chaperone